MVLRSVSAARRTAATAVGHSFLIHSAVKYVFVALGTETDFNECHKLGCDRGRDWAEAPVLEAPL